MKTLLLTLLGLGMSCIANAQDRSLTLTFDNQAAQLIPAETTSCNATLNSMGGDRFLPDLKAAGFQLMNPAIKFDTNGPEVAQVKSIILQVNAPQLENGAYQCEIAGDELQALFAKSADERWSGKITAGETVVVNPTCLALKCGGVSVIEAVPFSAVGSVTVNAEVATGITGEIQPLQTMMPFELQNPVSPTPISPF